MTSRRSDRLLPSEVTVLALCFAMVFVSYHRHGSAFACCLSGQIFFVVGSHHLFAHFLLRAWTVPSPWLREWGIPLAHENLSQTDLDDCVLGPEDITLYNDPQWLKNGYRRDATQCTRVSTLIHMLSKGRQLPRDLLEKGLVGQYFDTGYGPRWPTKHELCALMGFHRCHCESMPNSEAR